MTDETQSGKVASASVGGGGGVLAVNTANYALSHKSMLLMDMTSSGNGLTSKETPEGVAVLILVKTSLIISTDLILQF